MGSVSGTNLTEAIVRDFRQSTFVAHHDVVLLIDDRPFLSHSEAHLVGARGVGAGVGHVAFSFSCSKH
jgi:hypothetical protein